MEAKSSLIEAFRGVRQDRPPVWFMRQAGRYLPEYRELRKRYSMMTMIRSPELACKVTLQPLERFDLDGAIIYADILNPLIGMGIELDFVEGEGPKIFNPITCAEDVEQLKIPELEENVGYTLEAIRLVKAELLTRNIPVIGFAGAPFTLCCYIIEQGGAGKNFAQVKKFATLHPEAWHQMNSKLVAMLTQYLIGQAEAGVGALQIFDSWVGVLSPLEFATWVKPYLIKLIASIRRSTDVPLCYFGTNTAGLFSSFADLDVNVIGVDWRIRLNEAKSLLNRNFALQGNLDPTLLVSGGPLLKTSVEQILIDSQGSAAHIFNVGHGFSPDVKIENVEQVIKLVKK